MLLLTTSLQRVNLERKLRRNDKVVSDPFGQLVDHHTFFNKGRGGHRLPFTWQILLTGEGDFLAQWDAVVSFKLSPSSVWVYNSQRVIQELCNCRGGNSWWLLNKLEKSWSSDFLVVESALKGQSRTNKINRCTKLLIITSQVARPIFSRRLIEKRCNVNNRKRNREMQWTYQISYRVASDRNSGFQRTWQRVPDEFSRKF